MRFVVCPLIDPIADQAFLCIGEGPLVAPRRGHDGLGVGGNDVAVDLTGLGIARNNGRAARACGDGIIALIEAEILLPRGGVLAVALKAAIAENRADVAAVADTGVWVGRGV